MPVAGSNAEAWFDDALLPSSNSNAAAAAVKDLPGKKKRTRSNQRRSSRPGAHPAIQILIGVVMCVSGVVLTTGSYQNATKHGGTYTVFHGLIIMGAVSAVLGFIRLFTGNPAE